jgi:hypothetical protein
MVHTEQRQEEPVRWLSQDAYPFLAIGDYRGFACGTHIVFELDDRTLWRFATFAPRPDGEAVIYRHLAPRRYDWQHAFDLMMLYWHSRDAAKETKILFMPSMQAPNFDRPTTVVGLRHLPKRARDDV